jgi:Dyp-type peroxidase family
LIIKRPLAATHDQHFQGAPGNRLVRFFQINDEEKMTMKSFSKAPAPLTTDGAGVSPLRDLANEDVLRMESIQSDLLLGHAKEAEAHIFFKITDAATFISFITSLPITSAAAVYRPDGANVAYLTGAPPPNPRYTVGFTAEGLAALGRDPGNDPALTPFQQNLHARAVTELNDPDPSTWVIGRPADEIHGVLVITAAAENDLLRSLAGPFASSQGYDRVGQPQLGKVRPNNFKGTEHFGFLDGVSQPGMRGCVDPQHQIPLTLNSNPNEPDQGLPGQDLLWPGEFILGYHAQKAGAAKFQEKGDIANLPAGWMQDGSFMVIRRLTQFVPEMHKGIANATPSGQRPEQLEAQIVGRWPSGTPVITHPDGDDPELGRNEKKNNDFEFGNDRLGLTCPWAAHIRKTYPRDDVRTMVDPSEEEIGKAEAETQRHRLLRRGIQFGDELSPQEDQEGRTLQDRGLLFRCYVSDLARQFEFVQKQWANNSSFVQRSAGQDAIIGQTPNGGNRTFFGVGYAEFKPSLEFRPWVNMTGGAYFFVPSIDFLNGLEAVA